MSVDFQLGESRGYWGQQDPDLWFKSTYREVTSETKRPSNNLEYGQSTTMDLLPGESRGYWKHHSPDTDAEVSIVDIAFARKVGCYIDSSQIQDWVGIGDNVYRTEGRTLIKVALVGSLVYFFDIW
ncbi:hypothetical protein PHMEG_00033742, partial [Phytophthora megakarya]